MEDGILLLMSRYLTSVISELRDEFAARALNPEVNAADEWAEFEWTVDGIVCGFPPLASEVVDWLALYAVPNYDGDGDDEDLPF